MKLATQFRGTLVAIEEKSMTGSNNKYYQLAVLQGSEATSLSCTEEVYKQKRNFSRITCSVCRLVSMRVKSLCV